MGIAERKKREFLRRQEEIISAAYRLFVERGLEKVTIEMIAEAAEIGKGTIYKHFRSKHEIFAHIALRRGKKNIERHRAAIERCQTAFEQIKTVLRLSWVEFVESPAEYQIVKQLEILLQNKKVMDGLSPDVAQRLRDQHDELNGLIISVIQRGIDEGLVVDEPAEKLHFIGYGIVIGTIELLGRSDFEDSEAVYELMEKVISHGILKS